MTQNEYASCKEGLAKYIVDADTANRVQEMSIRLQSASSALRSALQECVTVYDEVEQMVNSTLAESDDPLTVAIESTYSDVEEEVESFASILSSAVLDGAKNLGRNEIAWFAEGEPVLAPINGSQVACWHMENDGWTATVCLDYLGGPRTQVPLSMLQHMESE